MTYIEIVNNVLRRMREDEVESVNDTTYSKMVGDFVNDAKTVVESAWDWSALRTTLTVTTQENVFNYTLVGSGNSIKELNVLNDTSNHVMDYRPANWFDQRFLFDGPTTGVPQFYTYNGVDDNNDTQIDIYPKPDGEYILRFNCTLRNPQLVNDTDKIQIPNLPIIHLAVALLARERGETGGTSTAEYFQIADQFLSDAIALDAQRHPEETIFYTA
jgi:hypothetical protein